MSFSICSAQDLFNFITDGSTKLDVDFKVLKNVDDFLLYGTSLKDVEEQIEKLMHLCTKINLKLAPSKFVLNTAVKFGRTVISAEKIKNNSVIFLDPPDKRILAVTEMERPKTRKDLQGLTGMISALRAWFPSVRFAVKSLFGASGNVGAKFIWTPEMEKDFQLVKHIFNKQIRLSPFDPKKKINLLIDWANGSGVGYVLYQHVNDEDPGGEVVIINANSSALKDNQTNYSAINCEILGLKFAVESNVYYLYGAPEINVFTDANSIEGIFQKNLGDIENKRIQRMVAKLMPYRFTFHHIPGKSNKIADCLSRLTRQIRETEHFELADPVLADHAVIKKIAVKSDIQVDDHP